MKLLKKPLFAALLCILIVFTSTVISINVKLNNKCEAIIDSFYEGTIQQVPIYSNVVQLYEIAEDIILVAENYGIDTRALQSSIQNLRNELNFKNDDFSDIFSAYSSFTKELRSVEIALSSVELSHRHLEYMDAASKDIFELKTAIDASKYNDSVKAFYKKFDRFPTNIFAEIFDIDFPEYFA